MKTREQKYLEIIEDQRKSIERLRERISWEEVQFNSLRETYNQYFRETDKKLQDYIEKFAIKNFDLEKENQSLKTKIQKLEGDEK